MQSQEAEVIQRYIAICVHLNVSMSRGTEEVKWYME